MTQYQMIIGGIILCLMVLRPFVYKPCVQYFPSSLSVVFTAVWLLIGCLVLFPFCGGDVEFFRNIGSKWAYFVISVVKGGILWVVIKLQQEINKESTSSSVFLGFIAMALGSLVNNLFFKEGLQITQLVCIVALGGLGGAFLKIGDAQRLDKRDKFNFIFVAVLTAMFSVCDHLAIPQVGWYGHLWGSSLALFVMCCAYGISKDDFYQVFRNKYLVIAGIVYVVSEFLIIYASIKIMPVSFVAVFMRMAAPVVMLISAVIYREQSLTNQLVFSFLALMFALPLLFL